MKFIKIEHITKFVINALLFLLISGFMSVNAQNCNVSLKVEKNRSYKSINSKGTPFKMILTNNGNSTETFSITTDQISSPCSNKRKRSNAPNAKVNVRIDERASKIVLRSNESKTFIVYVSSNDISVKDRWGCVKVIATSRSCGKPIETILSAYISNSDKK